MGILETQAFIDIVCFNMFCKYPYFRRKKNMVGIPSETYRADGSLGHISFISFQFISPDLSLFLAPLFLFQLLSHTS